MADALNVADRTIKTENNIIQLLVPNTPYWHSQQNKWPFRRLLCFHGNVLANTHLNATTSTITAEMCNVSTILNKIFFIRSPIACIYCRGYRTVVVHGELRTPASPAESRAKRLVRRSGWRKLLMFVCPMEFENLPCRYFLSICKLSKMGFYWVFIWAVPNSNFKYSTE